MEAQKQEFLQGTAIIYRNLLIGIIYLKENVKINLRFNKSHNISQQLLSHHFHFLKKILN
jgi:hypothetical protein